MDKVSTLEEFNDIHYPIVSVPFHGTPVFVKLRELTSAQLQACGDFTLIETFKDKINMKKKLDIREITAFAERQHNIVREALVSPTYDQIFEIVSKNIKVDEKIKVLEDLKNQLKNLKSGPKKSAVEREIDNIRIWIYYLLPDDFTAWITSYSLKIDKTDIKQVTEKMLLDAAILAVNGSDNPHNHIDGKFTEFNKYDIDKRAWAIYADWKKENKK